MFISQKRKAETVLTLGHQRFSCSYGEGAEPLRKPQIQDSVMETQPKTFSDKK
jgi:hypothetical protein